MTFRSSQSSATFLGNMIFHKLLATCRHFAKLYFISFTGCVVVFPRNVSVTLGSSRSRGTCHNCSNGNPLLHIYKISVDFPDVLTDDTVIVN